MKGRDSVKRINVAFENVKVKNGEAVDGPFRRFE